MTKRTPELKALICFAAVLSISRCVFALSETPLQADDNRMIAKAVVLWLSEGRFGRVVDEFTPQARERLSQEKLETVWKSLVERLGSYQSIVSVQARKGSDTEYPVLVFCLFEQTQVAAKVVFDEHHRISGLWFSPADEIGPQENDASVKTAVEPSPAVQADASAVASAAASQEANPASALDVPEPLHEREVVIGKDPWALPGTLTLPAGSGPFAAVVLVHGSGPQDRDETTGKNKPFFDLASGLARRGVAVLRYEKRTKVHAQEVVALKDRLTVKEEVIDDALSAIDLLSHAPEVDPKKVFLLGHSMGGWLLPRIAQATDALAGGIILAGNTRPLEVLIVDQMSYLMAADGSITEAENIQLDQLKLNVAKISDPALGMPGSALGSPLGVPASYWLDLRGYHPAAMAAELKLPLFILQGERDYQVTLVDYAGWKAALHGKPSVKFKTYPKLNHLFMEGEGKSVPEEYERPGHVSTAVIQDIADWVLEQGRMFSAPPNP